MGTKASEVPSWSIKQLIFSGSVIPHHVLVSEHSWSLLRGKLVRPQKDACEKLRPQLQLCGMETVVPVGSLPPNPCLPGPIGR